ncbi:hypothetical protein CYMTET_22947 [Cymbomonas tetramitiformis]|uniref:Uncharacterized protein n=1 Tax=Cymbomonas tetramitiformis TaxID=36881 RepID=A0AAE0FZ92_9CHLO|nr:hypothetical protein CYMTET_22947 [Cymbomonas tetramitiformis]
MRSAFLTPYLLVYLTVSALYVSPVEAQTCVQLNNTNWMPINATRQLRIGAALTVTGKFQQYAEGYCKVMTMWLEFFTSGTTDLTSPAFDGGIYQLGVFIVIADVGAAVFGDSKYKTYESLKALHALYNLDVFVSPYSSTLSPYAGLAGDELQITTLAPGASAESVFSCPQQCTDEAACEAARFGCSYPKSRRFNYLFGSFSPATVYFRDSVTLSAAVNQLKTIAYVYEPVSFPQDLIKGARVAALESNMKVETSKLQHSLPLPCSRPKRPLE